MIDKRSVTDWLATVLATATGMPVGDVYRPATGEPPPYYLIGSVDTQVSGAPLADMSEDLSVVYQVTCVSGPDPNVPDSRGTADQAEWMADTARRVFLGRDSVTGAWLHPLTVPGIKCRGRSLALETGEASDPTDAIISSVIRIQLDLTAA